MFGRWSSIKLCCKWKKFITKDIQKIWIQPAAGDAGGSLGAALALWYDDPVNIRQVNKKDDMQGSYLGPKYDQEIIEKELKTLGANYKILSDEQIIEKTAVNLADEKAVGWFQGRMEFGPRALGGRSILANPKSPNTQKNLNLKVKYRESFRPFAPSVLNHDVSEWFELDEESPYMLLVAKVKQDKIIKMNKRTTKTFWYRKAKCVSIRNSCSYTCRLFCKDTNCFKETNLKYFNLISKFKEKNRLPNTRQTHRLMLGENR